MTTARLTHYCARLVSYHTHYILELGLPMLLLRGCGSAFIFKRICNGIQQFKQKFGS
jgi:hypothetical protein